MAAGQLRSDARRRSRRAYRRPGDRQNIGWEPVWRLGSGLLYGAMFVAGTTVEVFGVSWMTALHQEIPEDKLSRVSAYDWFGSVSVQLIFKL